jgi:glycosyltransferase involved in cell wall biosynthesis
MISSTRSKVVLLGMMGRMRVAGAVWQAMHYLVGFERLGYEPYYIEAHGCTPWAFLDKEADAAAFIDSVMRRFNMGDRWAFHAVRGSGTYYGMSEQQVKALYRTAMAIFNLHGGTEPTDEQSASGRLVYIDTDPVNVQIEIHAAEPRTLEILGRHCAFFTFAENYGNADCGLPVSDRFQFKPTRQPVVIDFWDRNDCEQTDVFTTVGNWRQVRRVIEYKGEDYHWSKHLEFLKFLHVPTHTGRRFELALSSCDAEARSLLGDHGWSVRDASAFTHDLDAYRAYITRSKGEFTVAKDQNIRMKSGWFSDRSATYLASGRPVITQETGFSNILPAGEGLFGFSNIDEIASAVEAIDGEPARHQRAAAVIAREYFAHDVVLGAMLEELGLHRPKFVSPRRTAADISVIGKFSTQSGMAATARAYARALEAAGERVALVDTPDAQQSAEHHTNDAAAINLICCDAASYFSIRAQFGERYFRHRYNIGLWQWESPDFPDKWYDRFVYHDEIWAPSAFVASTLAPVAPIPIVRIPHVLTSEVSGSRERGRRRLALTDDFTFAFIFDFYSRHERKNPLAIVEAFQRAFQPRESTRLIIKCANAQFDREHYRELNQCAEGHRISILEGLWSAQEIADLTAACDCYVSLHRAEGLGLTISDAMAAGKPIIATGWSGNMEFMNVANSFPVGYRLTAVERRVGPYRPGEIWAEPSVEHAAELMRYVFEHPEEAAKRGELAKHEIEANYSETAVGAVIARRLKLIRERSEFQNLKYRLEMGGSDPQRLAADFASLGAYVPKNYFRYTALKEQLKRIVASVLPADATLAVLSKGDDDLLRLGAHRAWHFPEGPGHKYAGHHPASSDEAIRYLEAIRKRGGQYLLLPNTAFWWLEHYSGFGRYLEENYKLTHRDEHCWIWDLSARKQITAEQSIGREA